MEHPQPRSAIRAVCASATLLAATAVACSSPESSHGASQGGAGGARDAGPSARRCTIELPSRTDWRLRADGTRLRDALGRVVLLRGVNAGGRSKFAPNMPFDVTASGFDATLATYMDRAKGWGIDVLRVPFVWAAVEPTQGTDDTDFLGRYDALLDAAWARGIWTVVDFHQDVYAENFCGDGFPAWTIAPPVPAAHHDCPSWSLEYFEDAGVVGAFDRFWAASSPVQASFASMWDRMVARYKDKPGVLGFEVINEPSSGSADAATFAATTLTAFHSTMVARMRTAAPDSLVFVDPLGVDGVAIATTLARPDGDGIVFAPHFYPLVRDPSKVGKLMTAWADVGSSWKVPVWVGEFGVSHDDGAALAYMTAHFDALDALALGGTEWEYSLATEEWNAESDSLVKPDGTEYPVARAVQRPFARAIAGDAFTTGFDTSAGTFTLTFAPSASGITEVSLPSAAYPTGFDVALTGGCVDASHAGLLLVKSDAGAASVALEVTRK